MEQADHRERDLNGDEDGDHNNEHHGCRVCVPLTTIAALLCEAEDGHSPVTKLQNVNTNPLVTKIQM